MVRVVFAGGGTGGHVFPAVAIAERLVEMAPGDTDVMFVGTKTKIEARVIPQLGYKFRSIWISGFSRAIKPSNLLLPFKVIVSIFQSLRLLLAFRPDVVVATGGYVSGPVCVAALLTRVPLVLQEHNSYPGAMIRMFAPFARQVHIAFDKSKEYFRTRHNLLVSGSPVRKMQKTRREEALRFFGLDVERRTIFLTGGSLGSVRLNTAMLQTVNDLMDKNYQIIWQTGSIDFDRVKSALEGSQITFHGRIERFIDRMDIAYSASDVVVCRGGATTIAELIYFSLPAVIVPYPYAAANHQFENARALVEKGAAIMVQEFELEDKFKEEVLSIVSDSTRFHNMRNRIRELSHGDAAEIIASSVLEIANGKS
jgi:UDP-N-acetylglucosamine--N-acetylmuramyl-(pentapeptide) pyrophosphoryl-undecaprenol N-acetylglucosamine transferase